ncbi:MAG: acyl-CoA synthetase, partial [Pseudomonadota bacterium]
NLPIARPTSYAGAPLGWSMVADALEADESLAKTFFAHLNNMAFGSAAMPQPLAKRLEALTVKYTGKRLAMGTSLASTEVASGLTRYWICEDREVMGLPVPDVEVKLIPFEDKYEVRMRSKTVTPGYINDPEKTAESFDEEGFFKMGDAVRFFDSDNPVKGLCFAGRVSEEFKLQTGTWVSAGTLRAEVVAAASPYVRDVVVCGLNETYIALMIWPNLDNCAKLTDSTDSKTIATSKAVQTAIAEGLARHNQANPGSSKRIRRFLLLDTQPDLGAYEITDKGYINQSAAQRNRADQIARLYREIPDGDVMEI